VIVVGRIQPSQKSKQKEQIETPRQHAKDRSMPLSQKNLTTKMKYDNAVIVILFFTHVFLNKRYLEPRYIKFLFLFGTLLRVHQRKTETHF
jgi:hypothetical protein